MLREPNGGLSCEPYRNSQLGCYQGHGPERHGLYERHLRSQHRGKKRQEAETSDNKHFAQRMQHRLVGYDEKTSERVTESELLWKNLHLRRGTLQYKGLGLKPRLPGAND